VSARALRIAVLIPCSNEEVAIAKTVTAFGAALPDATIYVYDNNSRDASARRAREAGAIVRTETLQGKGHVVRRMFSDVEADVYVLADGDATYDATSARAMVDALLAHNLDMVVGKRAHTETLAYRSGHRLGNRMLTALLARLFGQGFSDILSGYRVFSRRFVKSFPALSTGFEVETELTVHALTLNLPSIELSTPYSARPTGSSSKLHTYRDGLRILRLMLALFKNERPLLFFGIAAVLLALSSMGLSIPIVITFLETGLVPRFPTAILAASIMLLAFLSLVCGLVLETVTRGRRETKRLAYLNTPAPREWLELPATPATPDGTSIQNGP
jgi:glycosyltransferase involved in cell wall biosynthesis